MSGGYSVCHSINQTALPRALWEYGSAETSGRSAPHLQPDTRRGWFLCGGWSLEGEGELPNSTGWRNVSLLFGGQSLYCQASKDSEKPHAVCLARLKAGLPELLLLDSPFCSPESCPLPQNDCYQSWEEGSRLRKDPPLTHPPALSTASPTPTPVWPWREGEFALPTVFVALAQEQLMTQTWAQPSGGGTPAGGQLGYSANHYLWPGSVSQHQPPAASPLSPICCS